MSREIILGLADGDVDDRSPSFKAFVSKLGENVGKFKSQWIEVFSGSPVLDNTPDPDELTAEDDDRLQEPPKRVELRGWQIKAVLTLLGHMSVFGPQGGLPPIQAICKAMLAKERSERCPRTDEDWMFYFLKVFHREQKKFLLDALGEGGGGELRRRLLKALRLAGALPLDDIHLGLRSATTLGIDAVMVAESIGSRAAGGNSRSHEGAMPTVGQLQEMAADVLNLFPANAPSFLDWRDISTHVFNIGLSQPRPPGGSPDGDDEGKEGLSPDYEPDEPGGYGDRQASHADAAQVRSLIGDAIAGIDGKPFPRGVHGRTFVEFLLFAERTGEHRVTQEDYANRTGVSDGTVAYRRDAIFRALRESGLDRFDNLAIIEAFRQMEEAYLCHHLEVFGT